jgi:protein-arginine kinase activator protein McsA
MSEIQEQEGVERCGRCGVQVFSFSMKRAESDQMAYCTKCAERVDSEYMAKNLCSVCTRLLSKGEVRFLLPSMLYSDERLEISKRLVCSGCYRKLSTSVRSRMQFASRARQIRESLRRSIVRRMFTAKTATLQKANL